MLQQCNMYQIGDTMTTYETLGYPNMSNWPVDTCGLPPSIFDIKRARAFAMGKPGTKRELAVAAYLRDTAAQYDTKAVAWALQQVIGGAFNPLLNVINADFVGSAKLGSVIKAKVGNGTAYKLVLNDKGMAKLQACGLAEKPVDGPVDDYGQPVTEKPVDGPVAEKPVDPVAEKPVDPVAEKPVETKAPAKPAKQGKGKGKGKPASTVAPAETPISDAAAAVADKLVEGLNSYVNGEVPATGNVLTEYGPPVETVTVETVTP